MGWKEAIIEVMRKRSGREWPLQSIYGAMERHPLVTTHHEEPWKAGKQPRYQCWIRRYLTDLWREGRVERVRRAVYRLSPN